MIIVDFTLDVIIPWSGINDLNLHESLVSWGGEVFSRDPPQYENDTGLVFIQNDDMAYYRNFRQSVDCGFYSENYLALSLDGSHVMDLGRTVNQSGLELSNNNLVSFLEQLSVLDEFMVFLIRDEEEIDSRYWIHSKEDLINTICNCLLWTSPEGAILIKAGHPV